MVNLSARILRSTVLNIPITEKPQAQISLEVASGKTFTHFKTCPATIITPPIIFAHSETVFALSPFVSSVTFSVTVSYISYSTRLNFKQKAMKSGILTSIILPTEVHT